jgi:segregation and condensation protein A
MGEQGGMYKVQVEKFEGPLDLLLELIEDEKLDITEIALAKITDKYLGEVSHLDPKVYDVAEFMLVAARLIYLKSKALLPSLVSDEEEAEIEDLKEKLEVYRKYKEAAREFGNILSKNQRSYPAHKPKLRNPSFVAPKGVEFKGLWNVFQKLLTDMPEELSREQVELPQEKITVEEKLMHLTEIFKTKKVQTLSNIIKSSKTKIDAIITFLAVLELIKLRKLSVTQSANFKDIELTRI